MLTLYHTPESVCSQKVRIGLAEIGKTFESYIVDTAAGEHFTEAFMKLNPDSVIPVIDDDGVIVRESSLILEYLDETYNEGRLTPITPAERVAAKLWLIRCLEVHTSINSVTFATKIRDIDLARTAQEREARWARLHDPVIAVKRRDLFENGLQSIHVRGAIKALKRTIADISETVSETGWLVGNSLCIADIAIVAYIDRLDRIGLSVLWADHNAFGKWFETLRARPSYINGIVDWQGASPDKSEQQHLQAKWLEVISA